MARSDTLEVLNGQVNLGQSISDINVTVEYGDGAAVAATSVGNTLTGAAVGQELDLTSDQSNDATVSATATVDAVYVEGYVGAATNAVGNSLLAGTEFTGGTMNITQTNNSEVTATTNVNNGESYGQIAASATATGNSAVGSTVTNGNDVDLGVTNTQTNNADVRATVNVTTVPNQASAFIAGTATAVGNSATFGSSW